MTKDIQTLGRAIVSTDVLENEIIDLCDKTASHGVNVNEIAGMLLFVLHYMLCQQSEEDTENSYAVALETLKVQQKSIHEVHGST